MIRRDWRSTTRGWISPATVALLALLATVTSIGHDFAFDDVYVIMTNDRVHHLAGAWKLFGQSYWPKELGGDGYRPVMMVLFALQWVAGGGSPWFFHFVNILLAIATALAVYWCAVAVLPRTAACLSAALFAIHPVHVEVTGNVVGQLELIAALCLCLAIGIYLRARRAGPLSARHVAAIIGLFTIGLLTKEHVIVLPAILLAAEWTVLSDVPWRDRGRDVRLLVLLLGLSAACYLYVRGRVLPDLGGFAPHPVFVYLKMGALPRIETMMNEIPRIAQLLVFPVRLSADYTPGDVVISQRPELIQLPGVFICLGVTVLAVALRRRSPVASFGLLWLILAFLPVSNLIVPAGFVTAERTLFFPSVGVVLVAGAIIDAVARRARRVEQWTLATAISCLLVLGLARSIDRQKAWKDNETLFPQTVRDQPNGYRAHYMYGRYLALHNRPREMEIEFKHALRLFPYDVSMVLSIGSMYYRLGLCEPANALLGWAYDIEPASVEGRYAYARCLAKAHRWNDARDATLQAMRMLPGQQLPRLRRALAEADSALGRPHHTPPNRTALSQSARQPAKTRSAASGSKGD
ncbi:MAG TPA: hypothetical protein VFY85_07710 [Gemmatimonadaceae bacterium]|nr:hypothetical protein [Gemmatimonadaceae bacterium]